MKIETFFNEHTEKGELYVEYSLGQCTKGGDYPLCNFCESRCPPLPSKSPRPFPYYSKLPKHKYLLCESTPMENRPIDDYLPRANLKMMFKAGDISSSDNEKVNSFVDEFIVQREHVIKYLQHLEWLDLKENARLA